MLEAALCDHTNNYNSNSAGVFNTENALKGIMIICGDAYAELNKMKSETIDCVVTSPPYDNLRTYDGLAQFDFKKFIWVAGQLTRVLKPGGVIVWVVSDQTINGSESGTSFKQALFFKDNCKLNLHDTMIYQKDGLTFPDVTRYHQSFDYMFILSKGRPKTINLLKDRRNKEAGKKVTGPQRERDGSQKKRSRHGQEYGEFGLRFNIWKYHTGYMKSSKDPAAFEHPAIFPEKLVRDHLLTWTNKGDLVMDPFFGSGTTGIVALELHREFIGIDHNPKYVELAKRRLTQVQPTFKGLV